MTEPRIIPADEAKTMMEGSQEQHEWWPDVLTPVEESAHDLAHTVIAQAEQIKRLQAAIKELSREMEGYRPHEVAWVELTHDDILKFEDMEDIDE